jgi:hypothetical protein
MAGITLPVDMYTDLISAERKLSELDSEYDKAEECGVDCQQLRTVRQMLQDRIEALRRNYAPSSAKKLQDM